MKTAERILLTSLDLFNRQGEANVSSVDIAVELEISPGNLYYHFKGKEVIVAALFDLYRNQIDKVMAAGMGKSLSVEDFFYFLYLLLEKGQLFRFIFHNPAELMEKYPSIARPLRTQLHALDKAIAQMIRDFNQRGQIKASAAQQAQMVELIGLVFTQSVNYYALKQQAEIDEGVLFKSLANILFALLPYIDIEQGELHHLQEAISSQSLNANINTE